MNSENDNDFKKPDDNVNLKRLKYLLIKDTYFLIQKILKNQINEDILETIQVNLYLKKKEIKKELKKLESNEKNWKEKR